jgi:ABC-type transport system substrate-binding protein
MAVLRGGKSVLSIVLSVAFVLSLAACGSSSTTGKTPVAAKGSSTLRWWNNWGDTWVKSFDPAEITDSVSIANVNLIYSNLVKADYPSLKIIPDLATWTVSSDHKVYTFHIKKAAKFSNGDPVTADDAAWSISRALLPATKSPVATTYLGEIAGAAEVAAGKATTVSGLKVVDAHTLQITLKDPIAYFLGTLSYPTADVLDKKVMQGKAPATYLTNTCSGNVGSGPFELVCLNNGSGKSSFYPSGHTSFTKFKPNPHYFGKKPKIDILGTFYAKSDDVYHAYEANEVDGTPVPGADLARAEKLAGFSKKPALITDYITPNQTLPPFNNVNCRLAVAYAVDRENINNKLLRGTQGPLYDVLPPGLPGYTGRQPDVPYFDLTKAKQYLNNCPGKLNNVGWAYQDTSTDITHEYNAILGNLHQIGANLVLKPLTFNAWLNVVGGPTMNSTKSQERITENLWLDDYPDSQDWLQNLLTSTANYDIGGFKNPTFDSLVLKGNTTFNTAQRASIYKQASKIALKDGAWIAVGFAYNIYVINPRVHGIINTASLPQPIGNDWSNVSIG